MIKFILKFIFFPLLAIWYYVIDCFKSFFWLIGFFLGKNKINKNVSNAKLSDLFDINYVLHEKEFYMLITLCVLSFFCGYFIHSVLESNACNAALSNLIYNESDALMSMIMTAKQNTTITFSPPMNLSEFIK